MAAASWASVYWYGVVKMFVVDRILSGFVDLGEVGSAFALLADDFDELVGRVGVVGVGEDVLGRVVAEGVFVASEEVDRVAAYAHSGAGNQAGVDGVANGYVGAACAFSAHVALGGEAGEEVEARGVGGDEGALRNALLHGLQVFGAGVQEEMHVGVDEAGHQRCVTEIDDLRTGGCATLVPAAAMRSPSTRTSAGRNDLSGGDIEHSRGVEDDCGLCRCGLSVTGCRREGDCKAAEEDFHCSSSIPCLVRNPWCRLLKDHRVAGQGCR